jgi:glycosyltransferase involved in cell wall biosynthesis
MGNGPAITIVLPVWNGEKYLEGAIKSVIAQTYKDFELIIVNDCSTDRSPQIAESFAIQDSRIKVIHNSKNLKLPASLNEGFRIARGRYLTWTSDDNLLHDIFLETLLGEIEAGDADIIYSDFNSIDDEGQFLKVSHVGEAERLVAQNVIGASFLYKRDVHEKIGGYHTDKFIYEDYDFWVRAYLAGFKFRKSAQIVYDYRRHANSLTELQSPSTDYAFYRYRLRKSFRVVKRETAFECRQILLGYRNVLGPLRWFRLLIEAGFYNPIETLKIIIGMARKVPVKVYQAFFASKETHPRP